MNTLFGEVPDPVEEQVEKFDFLKHFFMLLDDLHFKKKNLTTEEYFGKVYVPFMVNKGMSQFHDTLMLANDMNMAYHLPIRMQHDFYFYGVKKASRRGGKWPKAEKDETLELVKQYFGYNDLKAKQALSILKDEQITIIKESFQGGR